MIFPFQPEQAAEIAAWPRSEDEPHAWAGQGLSFPLDSRALIDWQDAPDQQSFVAVRQDKPIAYGELWPDDSEREVELARIIVHPTHRRSGLGLQLVAALLDQAQTFGFPQAFVRVAPSNHPAIACYQKAGFQKVSPAEQTQFNQNQPIAYVWLAYGF